MRSRRRLTAVLAALLLGAASSTVSFAAPRLVHPSARADGFELRRDRIVMRVTALSDQILRVRIGRDGALPEDASWAVSADQRGRRATITSTADGFTTAALRVRVDPATLMLKVEDLAGHIISADAPQPVDVIGRGFTLRKALPLSEHIYGLGDKTGGSLDRRGMSFVDWNTDAYKFSSSTDPIYKSIPFFIGAGGAGGSYGLLLDNSWRTWFDFGHRDADVLSMGAPDGPIDYYLIAGPSMAEVVRRYTDLTGKAPLPPAWGFGYQQSRYSYMNAAEVRQVVGRLRAEHVPTDVVWLDIDYQDRNRPFTVDTKAFPDLHGLVSDLGKMGVKLVTITDLHVAMAPNEGYAPYDSGAAGNHFVHKPDGGMFVGKVWPGASVFPDFTDASARTWWGTLFKPLVAAGVAGFWNDMNEPSVFEQPTLTMPADTVHKIASDDFRPRQASHAEVHNVYGMENTRATYDGMLANTPNERPFVMTRASYAGGQRYAVTWTGDNSSTWDHLKLSVHQLINLGLSGFSYGAADVGGFTGGPSPELMTRWFEIAAFTPIFRDHAAKDTPRAEPWVDGPEQLAIRRRFVEERYRLLPYIYALADENLRLGDPLMRPVFYDYPAAASASCDGSMAFTLGKALLVAPPPKPESPERYDVCLPAGGWYDYWTGAPVGAGGARAVQAVQSAAQTIGGGAGDGDIVSETPRLDRLPVFVRAGTILPRQPLTQSTSEVPVGPLQLDVYPGGECQGTLYADDGHSLDYTRGATFRQIVHCRAEAGSLRVDFAAPSGSFQPWWRTIEVVVHGWKGPAAVSAAGRPVPARAGTAADTVSFTVPASTTAASFLVERR